MNNMKEKDDARGFIILALLLLIVVPATWFILDANDIPSKFGFPVNAVPGQWSIILIGYFASVLGAITGFIATAYSVKKTIENQSKSRQEDNAVAALPLIQVYCLSDNNSKKCDAVIRCKYDTIKNSADKTYTPGALLYETDAKLCFKNVGQREMYNLRARCKSDGNFVEGDKEIELLPIIYKDEEKIIGLDIQSAVAKNYYNSSIEFSLGQEEPTERATIEFIFNDCYGNEYKQLAQMDVTYIETKTKKKTYQVFENSSIKACRIISAPSLTRHK